MKNVKMSQKLTESGLMIALATILSLLKLMELPYGGSITMAAMVPMVILSFRYGVLWGMLSGFVYGLIQMVMGLNNVSYATSVIAAIAIITLDYLFAFMSTAAGGLFSKKKNAASALGTAALVTCLIRYAFHVISGCTVWAGLSIPTADALVYSLIYNATYMIPESIITVVAAVYLGSVLDFRSPRLKALKREGASTAGFILSAVGGLVILGTIAAVAVIVFSKLQNPETGAFDITGIANVDATAVIAIVSAGAAVVLGLILAKLIMKKKEA